MYRSIFIFGFILLSLGGCRQSEDLSNQSNLMAQTQDIEKRSSSKLIDILVLVDQEDSDNFNGVNEAKIDHFISVTNRIYQNSNLDIRFQIKKIEPYRLGKCGSKELLYAIQRDGAVERLRNDVKADLVIAYRKYANDGICGIAFINDRYKREYGYAHVSLECVSTTTAHEIGHMMGLDHQENRSIPYAHGYGIEGEFHTIMAYGEYYRRKDQMYNYSSPQLECNGYVCGVEKELENGADAVSALRVGSEKIVVFN